MKQNSKRKKYISFRTFHVLAADCRLRVKSIKPESSALTHDQLVLIFLHEGLGCIEIWRDFPETLCQSTGCSGLVYERKGYGGSDKFGNSWPTDYLQKESSIYLPALLKACHINNAILIGHSDGGTIALLAAAAHQSPVRGVITEAAHIFVEEITLDGIRKAVKDFETTNLREKLTRYHKEKTDAIFNRWANRWLSTEFRSWNIEKYLSKVICPTLVIQGEDDEYGTKDQVDGIANQVSGSVSVKLLPDCGHIPHFQAKDIVIKEMTNFIKNVINS